jgi:hypothetical protein
MSLITKIISFVAVATVVHGGISSGFASGCDSGRSVQRVVGPADTVAKLRASAEASANSPFFTYGEFEEEELHYIGRTSDPGAFDLVLLETTWGESCRMTRRLLVFDNAGNYLGNYGGLSDAPTRLTGNTLFFPVRQQNGDLIEFSAKIPAPEVWVDGQILSFESVNPVPP